MITSLPQLKEQKYQRQSLILPNIKQSNINQVQQENCISQKSRLKDFDQNQLIVQNKTARYDTKAFVQAELNTQSVKKQPTIVYKQIQQYKRVSRELKQMSQLKLKNKQKLQKLQKKVSNIDLLQRMSTRETLKLHYKQQKLHQTQSYINFLQKLKLEHQQKQQQNLSQRKYHCQSFREQKLNNMQLSQNINHAIKQRKLIKIRQSININKQKYNEGLVQILDRNKQMAQEGRNSKRNLQRKLKKYQQYKLYIAKINYNQKVERQVQRYAHNRQYLKSLKKQANTQAQAWKKTQKLKQQTKKIQQFYLTGVTTEQLDSNNQ